MSKTKEEPIFALVKSMSKSEKRYFKLLASRHTIGDENNYVILFDYLVSLSEYDEKDLFKHFAGEAFLNKFSITKKRLYDHLLNALTQFHSSHHIEATIYKLLHGSNILFEKALYDQARKVLISAEKLALKHQLSNLLIEIRKHTKKLYEIDNYFGLDENELQTIVLEDELFHHQSQYEDQLWHIKSQIFQRLSCKGVARCTADFDFYESKHQELLQLKIPAKSTFESIYMMNHIMSVFYFATNKLAESYAHLKTNHQHFLTHPVQIEDHPNRFFSILTNLIYASDKLGYNQEASEYLVQLRKLHDNIEENAFQDMRAKLFSTLASIELSYHTKRGEFEILEGRIKQFEEEIENLESGISIVRKAFIFFKIATIQLALGDASSALKSVRKILNDSGLDRKEDIVGYAHLLEILIQMEKGRLDLIPHLVKISQRFLKSKGRFGEFEKELVAGFLRISQTNNLFDQQEKWADLEQKLERRIHSAIEPDSTEYFHWQLWAKAKSTNKKYIQYVKENALKQLFPAA